MTVRKIVPLAYADNVETIPGNELENVQRAVTALEKLLAPSGESVQSHGHIHAKSHGCVEGELRVLPNLPEELAQGVFSEERTFRAVARFSNSFSRPQADYIPDGRGMAIKLYDVQGDRALPMASEDGTQDFVMINHPVFFVSDVKEFVRLEDVLTTKTDNTLTKLQKSLTSGDWNPMKWHWREAINAFQTAAQMPSHPASNTYFSMTPIRFGKYVAKYRVRPAGDLPVSYVDLVSKLGNHADAMRLMLEETLESQQILFEFQVQLRTTVETMPVEDATVEWPESSSPFRTVALFLIPRQKLTAESQEAARQELSFNVWHAVEDHRPLGGINRLRKVVYPISAARRIQESAEVSEPV